MISHKHQMIITNVFRRLGMAALIAAAWIVGFELIVYLVSAVFNHSLTSFLVSLRAVPGTVTGLLLWVVAIYFLITPYSDFKWSIQNGISRSTMWRGRLVAMVTSVVIACVLEWLASLIDRPMGDWVSAWKTLLLYFTLVLTLQAIGNGFGLLNRKWKWIVGIGLPVLGMACLSLLMMGLMRLSEQMTAGQAKALVAFLQGLNSSNFSLIGWAIWIVYILLALWLTKLFNDHLQLRRD